MNRSDKIEALKSLQTGKISLIDFVASLHPFKFELLTDDELVLLERIGSNAGGRQNSNEQSLKLSHLEAECFEYYRLLSNARQSVDDCNGYNERVADWYKKLQIELCQLNN